jgi:hypothetical protein
MAEITFDGALGALGEGRSVDARDIQMKTYRIRLHTDNGRVRFMPVDAVHFGARNEGVAVKADSELGALDEFERITTLRLLPFYLKIEEVQP